MKNIYIHFKDSVSGSKIINVSDEKGKNYQEVVSGLNSMDINSYTNESSIQLMHDTIRKTIKTNDVLNVTFINVTSNPDSEIMETI